MSRLLENKVALVTGGSRGIGFAISEAFLREGAKVTICARDEAVLNAAATRLQEMGEVDGIAADVSHLASVSRLVDKMIERRGRIDLLVNNAAIGMIYGRVGEVDPEEWAQVVRVNLIGTFHCCHAVLPYMLKQGSGNIINLKGYGASFPSPRISAYGASKAGIVAFTRSLAREYRGSGIRINLLSPGVVKTRLLLNRETTAEGAPYLKQAEPLVDLLAGDAAAAANLAVKIGTDQTGRETGKEFRVMSKTDMAFKLFQYGITRFFRPGKKALNPCRRKSRFSGD